MATKFKLSRKVNPPRLACSPLRRRIGTKRVAFTQPGTGAAGGDQASLPLPVVAMSFKNAGVRRIVGQYTQVSDAGRLVDVENDPRGVVPRDHSEVVLIVRHCQNDVSSFTSQFWS